MNFTPLYVHIKKGAAFDRAALMGTHACRVDYLDIENGDTVGRIAAVTSQSRKMLEAMPGVTVLPPLHRSIKAEHISAFGYCGATEGDTGYDVAEKLHESLGLFWMHPEDLTV